MFPGDASSRRVFGAVVVVAILATVGAVALLPASDGQSANHTVFGQQAADDVAALDGINATVRTVVHTENGTSTSRSRVSIAPGTGKYRVELLSATAREIDLRVSNGSVLWLYDRDDNAGKTISLGSSDGRANVDRLQRLYRRLARSRTATLSPSEPSTPGVEPLPVVPHSGGVASASSTGSTGGPLTVSYEGNATVDGRPTYVVELTSEDASESAMVRNYTQRLWIDAEHYYPLQRQTTWETDDGERNITTTLRNVTFDPDLRADLFTVDPPEDATVTSADTPQTWEYDSAAQLRADASLAVPSPDVPASYRLETASRTDGRISSIGLTYVNATSELTVSKATPAIPPVSDYESVDIGSVEGEYRNLGPTQSVWWSCEEYGYKVRGSGVPKATLVDVAKSIGCS